MDMPSGDKNHAFSLRGWSNMRFQGFAFGRSCRTLLRDSKFVHLYIYVRTSSACMRTTRNVHMSAHTKMMYFREQNSSIWDPQRVQKSSIFIERVVIFQVSEVLHMKIQVSHKVFLIYEFVYLCMHIPCAHAYNVQRAHERVSLN